MPLLQRNVLGWWLAAALLAAAGGLAFIFLRSPVPETAAEPPAPPVPQSAITAADPILPPSVPSIHRRVAENYTPPRVRDPELVRFVDRTLPAEQRLRPDLPSSLPRIKFEEDIEAVVTVLRDRRDLEEVRNEAANLLSRSGYGELLAVLGAILDDPDEEEQFRSYMVQHLWQAIEGLSPEERETIQERLRMCLKDRHTAVRREALLALTRLKDPSASETAVAWLTQDTPDAPVARDAAIRAIRELDLREHLPALRQLAREGSEETRIAALVTLSQWGDEESRGLCREAAQASSPRLRRAGEAALRRLDAPVIRPSEQ